MNILFLNTSKGTGGAAIAASRIMNSVAHQSTMESPIHVDFLSVEDIDVHNWIKLWKKAWERLLIFLHNGFTTKRLWAVSLANTGFDITKTNQFRRADIIHIHWINQGFISLSTLKKILQSGKPVVWTMHDMWPLTGVCHHAYDCERYKSLCRDCPQLNRPSSHDLSTKVFHKKQEIYKSKNLHFVAVSSWLRNKAQTSILMQDKTVEVIPNTVSLTDFQFLDKTQCRRRLNLPLDKDVIVFGAAKLDDPIKGFNILCDALRKTQNTHLVLFGNIKSSVSDMLSRLPVPHTYMGNISSVQTLSEVYSAADIVVSASHYETFGQTLIEAMACGCLAVSFDQGGQTDIIEHLSTGYLAHYPDANDLAQGIRWAQKEGRERSERSERRESIEKRFSTQVVAKRYIELYNKLIQ